MAKKVDFKAEFEKQRASGVDINDPMNNLISKPEKKKPEAKAEPQAEPQAEPAGGKLAGFVPEAGGKRTKRVQLVMTPELYERTKAAAGKAGISFNEFVNQLCNKVTQ